MKPRIARSPAIRCSLFLLVATLPGLLMLDGCDSFMLYDRLNPGSTVSNGDPETATDGEDGEAETPDGEAETPDDEAETPDGEAETPDGEPETPDGEPETPDGEPEPEPVVPDPLQILPASVAVQLSETVAFSADGGTPAYVYAIIDGGGTIDVSSGLYTAPNIGGTATVRVEDAKGEQAQAAVTIVAPAALRIYPESISLNVEAEYLFSAAGGTTPYLFSLQNNQSGGSIEAAGAYTAGSNAGTDIIAVTDTNNAVVYAEVSVVAAGELGIEPNSPEVTEGSTVRFSGYGGTPPYTFSVVSGPGSVLATAGTYYAPAQVGTNLAEIRVTDSAAAAVSTAVTVVPAAPTNLLADGGAVAGPQNLLLTWTDNSAAEDGYRIERMDGATVYTLVATTGPDVTSYEDNGLTPNALYIYRVYAFVTGPDPLRSPYSNESYDFPN